MLGIRVRFIRVCKSCVEYVQKMRPRCQLWQFTNIRIELTISLYIVGYTQAAHEGGILPRSGTTQVCDSIFEHVSGSTEPALIYQRWD